MKNILLLFCSIVISTSMYSQLNTNPKQSLEQFTPDQADWSTFYSKPDAVSSITGHDPDGIGWINSWSTWDGTVYNPSEMTASEFTQAICPNGDAIRGIREVFYQHNPFADNNNPTKAEVDEWHRIAINHIRALVGYTAPERQVKKDICTSARALWAQERKWTDKWDADYPDGICEDGSDPHCGATFIPSLADQAPYLPDGHPGCELTAGAEGVSGAPKSDIPWSIKWSRAFCQYLGDEGFWGGHVGPFFHREKFGFSFWDMNPTDPSSHAVLRAKWTGTLAENLYENTLSVTDVNGLNQESKLFPNPAKDLLQVELAPAYDTKTTKLIIIDMLGKEIFSSVNTSSIDVSAFAPGVYILKLNDGQKTESLKFMKK